MTPPVRHYLKIKPFHKGFMWWCICESENSTGFGETEEACEISFQRHLYTMRLKGRRGWP